MSNSKSTHSRQPVGEDLSAEGRHPSVQSESSDAEQEPDLQEQMAHLQSELAEAEKRVLMAQADLENFRRRLRRETEEHVQFAAMPLVRDLLDVADNLERALQAVGPDSASPDLVQGVQMVADQLQQTLEKHGCRRMQAQGQPFDPHVHEAVGVEPTSKLPRQHVLRELRSGYMLHHRVVRPAQVILASEP